MFSGEAGAGDIESRLQNSLRSSKAKNPPVEIFLRPVPVHYFASIFKMKPDTIRRRLRNLEPVAWQERATGDVAKYDFVEALPYLIKPKVDIAEWIASQRIQDLPTHISDQFWKAHQTKQRVLKEAGDLWHTEDVLEVLGGLFLMIRDTTKIWIEELPGKSTMTTEQYEKFQRNVDGLLEEIHSRLVEMPTLQRTQSYKATIEGEIAQQDAEALGDSDED